MIYTISFDLDPSFPVPTKAECYTMWDTYEMLENVREHSRMVAKTALCIAKDVIAKGYDISEDYVVAAALLHDIAKTYTIKHGGDHAQLGASLVRAQTGNPYLAHAVLSHVIWPWNEGILSVENEPWRLPLIISYADKRVRHDTLVSIDERFSDLMDRYGTTELKRQYIQENYEQSVELENALKKYHIKTELDFVEINAIEL